MYDPQDRAIFVTEMQRLLTALSIELRGERVAVYWDALCDLSIEAVTHAMQHAARHWQPTADERVFPRPATLREYAREYKAAQLEQAAASARAQLPQWSMTPDEEGLQALRNILAMLGDHMHMPTQHQAYQEPATDDPETRKATLLAQARHCLTHTPGKE